MSDNSINEQGVRRTKDTLKQLQSLPLAAKIQMTKKRLNNWYDHYQGQVYLSFSGGKDSTVLKHIADDLFHGYDVPSVFCNTGLEYPEVKMFAMAQPNVTVIKPKIHFRQVLEKYGYPVISKEQSMYIHDYRTTKSEKIKDYRWNGNGKGSYKISEKYKYLVNAPFKISGMCCNVMKKNPFKAYEKETGRKAIIATMTDESLLRLNAWIRHGCNAFDKTRPTSQPMSFWTEQDVLQYIYIYKLPIAKIYGDVIKVNDKYQLTGHKRTGCMFCMYGVHLEDSPNRFQMMKQEHRQLHDFCINKLKLGEVLDYIGVDYE